MAVTSDDIARWAAGIGLPRCVGDEFVHEHGFLPRSLQELNDWGNRTGRRQSNGSWTCKGIATTPPTPPPANGGGNGAGSGDTGNSDALTQQITDFVRKNPIVVAVIIGLVLSRR